MESIGCGVLDSPPSRGITAVCVVGTFANTPGRSPNPPFHRSKDGIDRYSLELGHFAARASRTRLEEMFEL